MMIMVHKKYVSPHKDAGFRKWLWDVKNLDDRVILALGTSGTIGAYRKEYNRWLRRKVR